MKYRMFSSFWNSNSDDTTIKFSEYFDELDAINQLDILKDAIGMLNKKYEEIYDIEYATEEDKRRGELLALCDELASNPERRQEFLKMVRKIKPPMPKGFKEL
jgi:hypothetical protein